MNTKNNNNNIKFTVNTDNCLPAPAAAGNLNSSIKNRKCYRGPVFGRRTRVERVCAIDQWLRSKSYPNSQTMRARLGVTDRTILRDIDFMKFERRMPIDFDQSRNGYYYTKPVEALSQPQLSAEGIFSIMLAHKFLAQHPGTPFDKPMQDAFQQLIVQLDNRELESIINLGDAVSFRAFAPEHTSASQSNLPFYESFGATLPLLRGNGCWLGRGASAGSRPRPYSFGMHSDFTIAPSVVSGEA
jgi:hypothetical protein